ncbi:hypothetical protein J6590_095555 [Homalodisca vitripennis]|nr:hypothetical protein J6590_095555 [Homalodisca vitripennis]
MTVNFIERLECQQLYESNIDVLPRMSGLKQERCQRVLWSDWGVNSCHGSEVHVLPRVSGLKQESCKRVLCSDWGVNSCHGSEETRKSARGQLLRVVKR